MSYKLSKEKIQCKYDYSYWEDVVGDGGPRMQMWECTSPKNDHDNVEICNNKCPGYEPCKIYKCEKHDYESTDNYCPDCVYEDYEKHE